MALGQLWSLYPEEKISCRFNRCTNGQIIDSFCASVAQNQSEVEQ
jgi:hypothetical protein